MSDRNFIVAVPSYRRPGNVELMNEIASPDLWVVHDKKDYNDYRAAGAAHVEVGTRTLVESRNHILDIAQENNAYVCTVDDDIKGFWKFTLGSLTSCTFNDAVGTILGYMDLTGAMLGGVRRYNRTAWCKAEVRTWDIVLGGCYIVHPDSEVRFSTDPRLALVDDTDFSLRHLDRYGFLASVVWVAPNAVINAGVQKGYNKGGLSALRKATDFNDTLDALFETWPQYIVDNNKKNRGHRFILPPRKWPTLAREKYLLANGNYPEDHA